MVLHFLRGWSLLVGPAVVRTRGEVGAARGEVEAAGEVAAAEEVARGEVEVLVLLLWSWVAKE